MIKITGVYHKPRPAKFYCYAEDCTISVEDSSMVRDLIFFRLILHIHRCIYTCGCMFIHQNVIVIHIHVLTHLCECPLVNCVTLDN
jgi:hypothetical protein